MNGIQAWKARDRRRGVSLVEILIVVAIMATISGMAVMVAYPELKKSRIRTAAMGASAVREAAKIYREIDLGGDVTTCPTVGELVAARKLDAKRSADPWGSSFAIGCESQSDVIQAVSPGSDRRLSTPDDVPDDVTPAQVEAIAKL